MAIPWLMALRAVPWGTILANAPSIVRSADALVSRTRIRPDAPSRDDVQALVDRIAALERNHRDTAELLTQMTAQISALTTAGEVLEARAQWLLVATIVASVVSVVACGLALLAW